MSSQLDPILSKLNSSLRDYFLGNGFADKDFYCRRCGKLLVDIASLDNVIYTDVEINGKPLKAPRFEVVQENGKRVPLVHEPEEFRWFLFGKILHACNDKVLFRHTCWDCMYDQIETVIDVKHFAREKKWFKRISEGERPIPPYNIASSNYFKLIFDITDEELKKQKAQVSTATLEWHIKKYGEEEGKKKFEAYRKFQGDKNKKEYKMSVKGWTEEQFDEFNQTRASTKENFIARYGEEEGTKRWKEYCDKEAYVGNKLEYFIEKYGEEEGKKKYNEVCSMKSLTLKNFIRKYGEEKGREEYAKYLSSPTFRGFSVVSQELFEQIDQKLEEANKNSRWFTKNFEAEIEVKCSDGKMKTFRPDFLLGNKIIEFNGDYWHANPEIYSDDQTFNFDGTVVTAKQIHEAEQNRAKALMNSGYQIYVVWELSYRENPAKVVDECISFLKS